jgi:hypothetical protein
MNQRHHPRKGAGPADELDRAVQRMTNQKVGRHRARLVFHRVGEYFVVGLTQAAVMFMENSLDAVPIERASTGLLRFAWCASAVSHLEAEVAARILASIEATAKRTIAGQDSTIRLDENRRIR